MFQVRALGEVLGACIIRVSFKLLCMRLLVFDVFLVEVLCFVALMTMRAMRIAMMALV